VPVLLPIHIVAAALGLVSGAIALSVAKGGRLHRTSGKLFAYAIFAMCGSAVVIALVKGQAVNVMAGSMTAYLVLTGVATVRPPSPGARRRDIALMLVALALGLATLTAGIVALASPTGKLFGFPSFPFFLFGLLGVSGAIGDVKTMRADVLRGAPRLSITPANASGKRQRMPVFVLPALSFRWGLTREPFVNCPAPISFSGVFRRRLVEL